VNLIRLVDGEVPPYPIWITEEVLNWTLLDNVIEARRPDLSAQIPSGGLQKDELERQLETWAELLRLVAPESLEHDPSAIDDAAVVIRKRVGEHPQQVTVGSRLTRPRMPTATSSATYAAVFRPTSMSRLPATRDGAANGQADLSGQADSTGCVLSANFATRLTCSVTGQRLRRDRSPTFRFNV
jgi:hypothetical protein